MSANDSLPVILVSAVDAAAASVLISEIIDEDGEGSRGDGAVWQLRNKYYTAAARLLALPDGGAPPSGLDVQAHVIYLTEDECTDVAAWSWRAEAARALVPRDGVRLVAARAAAEGAALARWACARRYEPVALLAPSAPGEGAARLREALQAHAWPGMCRAPRAPRTPLIPPPRDDESDEEGEEWGEWVSADGEEERAGQFAQALAQLPGRRPAPGLDDATRRLRAERLVVAFCRALGHDLRLPGADGGEQ